MIILIICTLGFYIVHSSAISKINLKLDDQIGIAFINKDMLLILDEDDNATLLVLNNGPLTNLNKFHYRSLRVILLKDNLIDIEDIDEDVLDDEYEIDEVKYINKNGLIYIDYEGTNTCIYMEGNHNISDCNFIYFYNSNYHNIYFSDYNEIVMYYYKRPLPTIMLEHIYEQAIDIYPLRDDEITIIKLGEDDYDFIVIAKD